MANLSSRISQDFQKLSKNMTSLLTKITPDHEPGDIGFMILASVSLWILVPGSGFFYSGMGRSKGALSMIILSLWSSVIVTIQWFVVGYSLSFSTTGGVVIGNFDKVFLIGVYDQDFETAEGIPEIAFCFYQAVTACLPTGLIVGALAERARVVPVLLFILIWTTLAYDPICYWSLNPNGWSYRSGVLDFGGGAPVHVPAAAAALAYSYLLGPRSQEDIFAKPHNMLSLTIGTTLIWFGSFGYNSGSAFGATVQAVTSCVATNLAGAVGGLTWAMLDYIQDRNCSAFGLCAGAVVGLICITPASGFIAPASSVPFGIVGSVVCRWGHRLRGIWQFDDALDVFAMHGLAGIVGMILTGIFSQKSYGGKEAKGGGWVDGHWMQVPYQCFDLIGGFVWSFFVSIIVLFLMNKIPGLQLRVDLKAEVEGLDVVEMGVSCYEHLEEFRSDSIQYISHSRPHSSHFNYFDGKESANEDENQKNRVNNNGVIPVPQITPVSPHNWRQYWH